MPASAFKITERIRTTVRLPKPIYDEARSLVDENVVPVDSLNDFLVAAIASYVKLVKRKQIDAAFAGMADDADYQKEALLIAEQFAQSDWEALEIAEGKQK
jgi:hypothetical protein